LEYVESHSNIADIPSRCGNAWEPRHEDWCKLAQMGFEERPMAFPTVAEWDNLALFDQRLASGSLAV